MSAKARETAATTRRSYCALRASGEADLRSVVEGLRAQSLTVGRKVKGFRGHAASFMGYLIAHDGYHQGEIAIILEQSGYPHDGKMAYGIWDWRRPMEV